MENGDANETICRVCRCEGTSDKPLFHPCICTGSIKWIHQDCLLQWMRYSRKQYCELCRYRFSFTPIYAPNMPKRLPLRDVLGGLFSKILKGTKFWTHCTIVIVCWLGFVPIVASNVFRTLFSEHEDFSEMVYNLMTIPLRILTIKEDCIMDILQGTFIVSFTMVAFIGVIWLREQVLLNNGPDWNALNLNINDPIDEPPDVEEEEEEEEEENEEERMILLENNRVAVEAAVDGNVPAAGNAAAVEGNAPVVDGNAPPAAAAPVAAVAEPHNWNLIEWERAAEDLTWERLLGLDGSYVFLEHVFWVVSLNSLFIIIFVFFPHHLGLYFAETIEVEKYVQAIQFEGFIYTILGYTIIGCLFYLTTVIASLMSLERLRRFCKLTYIIIKVSVLLVVELSVLPVIAGWWLDVCTLTLFSGNLPDRLTAFVNFPGGSTFVHWLAGVVFAYYFTTFFLILRDVLRPEIFWFLRPANQPDFSAIREMIRMPLIKHITRLMALAMVFGIIVMLLLFIPGRILRKCAPTFLPYAVYANSSTVNELSLELVLLQIILPTLLEQAHVRLWTRFIIRKWCWTVGKLLNLHTILLGNVDQQNERERAARENDNFQHDALQQPVENGAEEPARPNYLWIRWLILLIMVGLTLIASSLIVLTLPVYIGRFAISLLPSSSESVTGQRPIGIHELYTASIGLYLCWLSTRMFGAVRRWIPERRIDVLKMIWTITVIVIKTIIASFWLIVIIPILLGLLLELTFMIPLKVSSTQTGIMNIPFDWAFGILYMKIIIAIIMIGPDSKLRRSLDRTFQNGFRGIDLNVTVVNMAIPISLMLCIMIGVPYVIAYSVIPFIVRDFKTRCLIARRIYPIVLFIICISVVMSMWIRQFVKLYERIKNDKYLVGKRLVNYNHGNNRGTVATRD